MARHYGEPSLFLYKPIEKIVKVWYYSSIFIFGVDILNTIDIDYASINSRQEFLSIYYLYFYICQRNRFNFDLGNFVIALLTYIVENGKLDFYAMKSKDIKLFADRYFFDLKVKNPLTNDDLNTLLNRLEGVNPDGSAIMYSFTNGSEKVSYIVFDIENDGYKITDMGLQFLISSREVPQESKLTVSLYLFRLQIKKHKYQSALDTIKNINLETKRQLSLKDKVLDVARYDALLGNKMYNEYWKDFVSLRSEENQHYQQAKDFLKEYQDISQNEDITPNDRELLRKIEMELNASTTLQNRYILEISSMGKELAEMNLNSISNVFDHHFDFNEHFKTAYTSNDMPSALITLLTPLLLPKKVRYFDVSIPFSQQPIKSKEDVHASTSPSVGKSIDFVDYSKVYENRKVNNYLIFFEILVDMLKESPIYDVRQYIDRVKALKGDTAIQSIDFLGFLTDLSSFSDVNSSTSTNVQTIHLIDSPKKIVCSAFDDTLSEFWFKNLCSSSPVDILISTNVHDVIYLDDAKKRSIGNMGLELKILKGDI